jgi:hypothetical protein
VLDRAMSRFAPRHRRVLLLAAAIAILFGLAAASALGELAQRGNLFIRFDGGIAPRALPRHALRPVSVRIEGTVRTPGGGEPPALRQIEIALNRAGKLSAVGLPTCHRNRVETATPGEALAACGTSLVGSGGIVARTSLADQAPATVRAEVLLFNATDGGHAALLAHIYQAQPSPLTRVAVFSIRHRPGTFGTVITGRLPSSLNRNGYLKSIFLQLERRYVFRNRRRSYISAACSAPSGFSAATFPFAKTSMTFEDGRTLSSTLVRSCRVS